MTVDELLDRLFAIKRDMDFSENRNDARRAYKLLKENNLDLKYEQNMYDKKILRKRLEANTQKAIEIAKIMIENNNYLQQHI